MNNNIKQIAIKNHKLYVQLWEKKDHQYALYFKRKSEIEKQFYQDSNSFLSQMDITPGVYTITSFFKNKLNEKTYNELMILISSNLEIQIIKERELANENNYKLSYYNRGSNKTFIVFNGAGSNKESNVFALTYLLNQGYNVVACWQDNENNYQDLSFNVFNELLAPIVNDHEVFLYGSSLGGYCAFYFAGAVNGTVISAAPLNPVDPILISKYSKESEFKDDDFKIVRKIEAGLFKHYGLDNNAKTSKKCYVFIDPMSDRDMYYLHNVILKAYPNVIIKECPFAGHTVLYHLNKTSQLNNIIMSIVKDIEFEIDLETLSEFIFYEKAKYYLSLAKEMTKSCLETAPLNPLIKKRMELLKNSFNL